MPLNATPNLANLQPVRWTEVVIDDTFWSKRQETNRNATLLHGFKMLKEHGYEENFVRAGKRLEGGFKGLVFQDSDVYKLLESVAYSLTTHPDAKVEREFDRWVDLIANAQMEDGYLNTHFQLKEPDKKWKNLRDWHELYCLGHLIEAGVADYIGNKKRKLLDVAIKAADHVDRRFGTTKTPGYPGHPELELALVKLYKVTGEKRYYDLARHFVKVRGTLYFAKEHGTPESEYNGAYWQDRVPIAHADVIEGHAVRAAYLLCAATDVVDETGDEDLEKMIRRVWSNATQKRMYVTGGIGNSSANEGFTEDYDLPNESAYQETCASIALAFWNHRLALLYGDSKYADCMERSLYNGVLSGVAVDGKRFFYENPLASAGGHHRRDWYACACCPPNISRLLSSFGDYIYAKDDKSIWINLFVAGSVKTEVGGKQVSVKVDTQYPWSGKITLTPKSDQKLEIRFRIPEWSNGHVVKVGGKRIAPKLDSGYAIVEANWDGKTKIEIDFPMPVRKIQAHPAIEANRGRSAIARGPIIYCLEQVDQTVDLDTIFIPLQTAFTTEKLAEFGATALCAKAFASDHFRWQGGPYRDVAEPKKIHIRAIPYAFWDNRAAGKMAVWMRYAPE
jgi:DUF1680 family protein